LRWFLKVIFTIAFLVPFCFSFQGFSPLSEKPHPSPLSIGGVDFDPFPRSPVVLIAFFSSEVFNFPRFLT